MNNAMKSLVVVGLIVLIALVFAARQRSKNEISTAKGEPMVEQTESSAAAKPSANTLEHAAMPVLIDLGADKCIPCKAMKPILDDLALNYKSAFETRFIDVWKNVDAGKKYNINLIPTQIFFDASGKELFRHEGFFSKEDILSKWKEFGVEMKGVAAEPGFERLTTAQADNRAKENVCYMCDGDIDAKARVTVQTEKGDVRLCGPHCYFIMYSCLTEDKTGFEEKVTVTNFTSGQPIALTQAVYLASADANGRPVVRAFADEASAGQARQAEGGNIMRFAALSQNELSHRCGFCDRSCYPQDASEVIVDGGVRTWGCCSHCALGVAARTGKDIEVRERDRLTGEPVIVKTLNGSAVSLEPATAVAWFGQRQKPDGTWASAGCFHQGFFTSAENLQKWVEQNPYETGKLITIHQALADKMKLSQEQIQKACKIGECSPK